jgi:hypothetical protein
MLLIELIYHHAIFECMLKNVIIYKWFQRGVSRSRGMSLKNFLYHDIDVPSMYSMTKDRPKIIHITFDVIKGQNKSKNVIDDIFANKWTHAELLVAMILMKVQLPAI